MVIFKVGKTGVFRVRRNDNTLYAVIGSVKTLLERNIIFKDNTAGNMEKWLGIEKHGEVIHEFNCKEDAIEYYRAID